MMKNRTGHRLERRMDWTSTESDWLESASTKGFRRTMQTSFMGKVRHA